MENRVDEAETFELRKDPFYSVENQSHLVSIISEYEAGINVPVIKTMEELEVMANE